MSTSFSETSAFPGRSNSRTFLRRGSNISTMVPEEQQTVEQETGHDAENLTNTRAESSSLIEDETLSYSGGPIMAVNWLKGKLGCAYYDDEFKELYVMDDTFETPPFNVATSLLEQVRPSIVLLSADVDDLRCEIEKFYKDERLEPARIETMPRKAFAYEAGKANLTTWHIQKNSSSILRQSFTASSYTDTTSDMQLGNLPSRMYCEDPLDGRRRQAYLELSCMVLFDNLISIGCTGTLLKFLDELKMICENCQREENSFCPLYLRKLVSDQYMQVSSDTQRALQIFEKDLHPNVHQKRTKESLSLFGVLDHTISPLGRHLLKLWLQRPTLDMETLHGRHRAVEIFIRPESTSTVKEIKSSLSHVKNIARILSRIRENQANPTEWQQLLQFAFYCLRIRAAVFQQLSQQDIRAVPILQRVLEVFDVDCLKAVVSYIDSMIDFEKSSTEKRIVVKDRVDEELDNMKSTYANLDTFLLQVAQDICVNLAPQTASVCNVVYFPQLGYLVTVPRVAEYANGIAQIPGFELQFKTAENLYYKNDHTKELDESLGDIHELIIDREIELLQELSDQLIEYHSALLAMADICAELDCLISFSTAAKSYNYVRPRMTTENKILIEQGRHPLQELNIDVFIPNDAQIFGGRGISMEPEASTTNSTESDHSEDPVTREASESRQSLSQHSRSVTSSTFQNEYSVWLLSGANFSGKSVYIRQVAIITYMAHVGSFVPADKATIGLTDKIFTCIQTIESVSKLQSAFALELQQLSQAINYATERSLVVIDEFGKGTSTNDGAALLCVSLGYFLSKGVHCPKVLAITHFHELISRGIISPEEHKIGLLTMEIISRLKAQIGTGSSSATGDRTSSDRMVEEVVFLYKVVPCIGSTNSFGAWCASVAGLPNDIVERAMQLSSFIDKGEHISPMATDENEYRDLERLYQEFINLPLDTENPKFLGSCRSIIDAVLSLLQ